MKNQTIEIKNYHNPLSISLILLFSLLLSACSGSSAVNNFPGLSANLDVAYLAFQGNVYAVNAENGTMTWKFPLDKPDPSKPFYAPPAVGSDGMIIAGNYGSSLYALNSNGEIQWQFTTVKPDQEKPAAPSHFVASPLILEDMILAPTSDYHLYALSLDGKPIWDYATTNELWAQPASDGELIFQPSLDHYLYALHKADGTLAWKVDLGSSLVSSPVLGEDGKLYINTLNGEVVSLNPADGAVNWRFPIDGSFWSAPVLHENILYIGSAERKDKGRVFAISAADGKVVWEKDAGGPVVGGGVLLPDGESLAFTTETGNLSTWAVADGSAKWTQPIGGKLYSTPVVAGDQLIVAVTQGDKKILQAVTLNGQMGWSFALPK